MFIFNMLLCKIPEPEPDSPIDDEDEKPAPEPDLKAAPEEDMIIKMAEGGGAPGVHTLTGTLCNSVEEPTVESEDAKTTNEEPSEPDSHVDNEVSEPAPTHEYETDEEKFLCAPDISTVACQAKPARNPVQGPVKAENTAKRNKSAQVGFDLAYFNLWWARMAIEGRKEAKELRKVEEEERLASRKRKWLEFGADVAEKRVTKDTKKMKDILSFQI